MYSIAYTDRYPEAADDYSDAIRRVRASAPDVCLSIWRWTPDGPVCEWRRNDKFWARAEPMNAFERRET